MVGDTETAEIATEREPVDWGMAIAVAMTGYIGAVGGLRVGAMDDLLSGQKRGCVHDGRTQ